MEKVFTLLLLLSPTVIYTWESYSARSFSISYINLEGYHSGLIGARHSFNIVWYIGTNNTIINLEVLDTHGGLLLSFINNNYDGYAFGVALSMDFFELSFGALTKEYEYTITTLGAGYTGTVIGTTDRNFHSTAVPISFPYAFSISLPLGFKIIGNNNAFFSFEHKIFIDKFHNISYSSQISIGKIVNFTSEEYTKINR